MEAKSSFLSWRGVPVRMPESLGCKLQFDLATPIPRPSCPLHSSLINAVHRMYVVALSPYVPLQHPWI